MGKSNSTIRPFVIVVIRQQGLTRSKEGSRGVDGADGAGQEPAVEPGRKAEAGDTQEGGDTGVLRLRVRVPIR